MEALLQPCRLGNLKLANRFVFPPIKTGYGMPAGVVTDRQLVYYRQIALNGPAVIILEPVSVTPEGREHPEVFAEHWNSEGSRRHRLQVEEHPGPARTQT